MNISKLVLVLLVCGGSVPSTYTMKRLKGALAAKKNKQTGTGTPEVPAHVAGHIGDRVVARDTTGETTFATGAGEADIKPDAVCNQGRLFASLEDLLNVDLTQQEIGTPAAAAGVSSHTDGDPFQALDDLINGFEGETQADPAVGLPQASAMAAVADPLNDPLAELAALLPSGQDAVQPEKTKRTFKESLDQYLLTAKNNPKLTAGVVGGGVVIAALSSKRVRAKAHAGIEWISQKLHISPKTCIALLSAGGVAALVLVVARNMDPKTRDAWIQYLKDHERELKIAAASLAATGVVAAGAYALKQKRNSVGLSQAMSAALSDPMSDRLSCAARSCGDQSAHVQLSCDGTDGSNGAKKSSSMVAASEGAKKVDFAPIKKELEALLALMTPAQMAKRFTINTIIFMYTHPNEIKSHILDSSDPTMVSFVTSLTDEQRAAIEDIYNKAINQ